MPFNTTADYYEVLANAPQRLGREGPLLLECLAEAPGRNVIDVACGTGIHALFFAEHEAEVIGMDLSPGMIEHARANRPHPRVQYVVGDMRNVVSGPWDLVVCLGNSLSLLPGDEDLRSFFTSVSDHMAPGGILLTQTLNYAQPKAAEPRHRIERAETPLGTVVAVKSLVPLGNRTLLSLTFFAEDGEELRACAEPAVLRNLSREDLERHAAEAGLKTAGPYGSFEKSPYDPDTSSDILFKFHR